MEDAMGPSSLAAVSTPQDHVDKLMHQMEHANIEQRFEQQQVLPNKDVPS
jgi:hypothetical protein